MIPFTVKTSAQLEAEEQAEADASRQKSQPVVTALAAYVRKAFQDAELHRQTTGVTERLLASRRAKSGLYDDAKIEAIRSKGGSTLFFNITETKCEAFEAWLEDVFAPVGDRPWDAQPTPIPSLPQESAQDVLEATVAQFSQTQDASPEEVMQFALDLYDETLRSMYDEAKETCERMVRKMEDQTAEGGFADALSEFVSDLGTYPSAILKGPVLVRQKRLKWVDGAVAVTEEVIPTWKCVDPFAFYPGPNARTVDESYICEIIDLDRRHLSEMRSLPGWNAAAIEHVLSEPQSPFNPQVGGETENAALENRVLDYNAGLPDATVRAIEFWGSVQGRMLAEWGMPVDDPFSFYEVNCLLVGDVVIKAVLNPDPLGRRPYYVCSFIHNKNSLWGLKSIPEKMADCQEGVNGAQRNLLNNLAIASGPQTAVDIDVIPPEHVPTMNRLYPWKVWPYRGNSTNSSREPIKFFQPTSNAAELIEVSEYYEKKSDDRTLIPRYVYGNENLGGAGQTASGLSMLMNAAARGIKRVIKNLDRLVLRPAIERLYTWNMLYLDDASLKGDVQVIPRGALAILVREQVQLRRQEWLAITNNPTDMAIIGMEGRAAVLRETAKGLDMDTDKIVPPEEVLRARTEQQLAAQAQQPSPGQQTEEEQ